MSDLDGEVDFYGRVGNIRPTIEIALTTDDGEADISGSTFIFIMINRTTRDVAAQGSAEVVDGPTGVVRYSWQTADVMSPGWFLGTFRQYQSGQSDPIDWPRPGALLILIDSGAIPT